MVGSSSSQSPSLAQTPSPSASRCRRRRGRSSTSPQMPSPSMSLSGSPGTRCRCRRRCRRRRCRPRRSRRQSVAVLQAIERRVSGFSGSRAQSLLDPRRRPRRSRRRRRRRHPRCCPRRMSLAGQIRWPSPIGSRPPPSGMIAVARRCQRPSRALGRHRGKVSAAQVVAVEALRVAVSRPRRSRRRSPSPRRSRCRGRTQISGASPKVHGGLDDDRRSPALATPRDHDRRRSS